MSVDERVVTRRLEDPAFRRSCHAARCGAFDHAIGLPQRYAAGTVNMLARVMNDPQTPVAAKITAAMAFPRVRARRDPAG